MANDEVLSSFTPGIEEKAIDTSRKLKVGIIGTGWIAESHIESYLQMPDVEIVAAADWIDGKAEKFMKRYGVDMETAHNAGMRAVGVLWGFRGEAELSDAGADCLAASPEELPTLLLSGGLQH